MINQSKYLILILFSTFLLGCDNFQDKLFSEIEIREINHIKSDTFDLEIITDFKWDSALYVEGNESVQDLKEFIEEKLNNKESKISWEDRKNGIIDKTLKYKSKDLPVNTDRFYFLTDDKELLTKDIDHYSFNQGRFFKVLNLSKDTVNKTNWISRNNFKIVCK